MKNNFSPSVNIIRDFNNDIDYYSTPNSERVIDTLNVNVLSRLNPSTSSARTEQERVLFYLH